jgi:hypothetical protein
VPRAAPPPSPPCTRPAARVCSESARGRPVESVRPAVSGASCFAHRQPSAVTRDAGFLRPPLGTAPLAPARRIAARIAAPARRGGATKAGCHVIASAGRRTTCRAAPPLARGSSVSAQRVRALLTQRVALARRVTALQLTGNVERTLRTRLTITARSAAFIARPR